MTEQGDQGCERRRPGRKATDDITEHQARTLEAIREFIGDRGIPPTVADLAVSLGLAGSTVHDQVNQLIRKGFLRREDGRARGLALARETLGPTMRLIAVPIVGRVAAGQPIFAEENSVGEVLVDDSVAGSGRFFALEVEGRSMQGAGIEPGDLVIVRQQPIAESGDIVVALLDGEATVKRLRIDGGDIALLPENPDYEPLVVRSDADLRVAGKVVAVRRPQSTSIDHSNT